MIVFVIVADIEVKTKSKCISKRPIHLDEKWGILQNSYDPIEVILSSCLVLSV
jgi:hypothetical protein